MADNILTTDRANADLDIAAKEILGVQFPRNILTDPSGVDLTPLTDAQLRDTPVPVSAAELIYCDTDNVTLSSTTLGTIGNDKGFEVFSITGAGSYAFKEVAEAGTVVFHMYGNALVGHTVVFEGSVNSGNGIAGDWFTIQVVRTNANTVETASAVLTGNPGYGWKASASGLTYIRVRSTAHTSGTAFWLIRASGAGSEPIPAAQVTGTVTTTSLDGTQLFSGTISATGAGAWIDTTGYSTLVMQISGTGRFLMYAEVSNDQTAVDNVLILSRDEVSLLDNIDSVGVYSVRPAARYIRYNVAQIVGSITGTIVGRTHTAISGADMLALAMERNNGLPLHVSLDDMSLSRLSPSNQPIKQIGFYSGPTIVPINTLLMQVDVSLYGSIAFQYSVGTTGVLTPAWSNDGATWFTATLNSEAQAGSTTMSAGTGYRITNVLARYFRLLLTTATTAGLTQVILYGNPSPISTSPTTQPVSGTVTATPSGTYAVSIAVGSNATSTAYEASRVIKGSAGNLWKVNGYNSKASAQFIQLHNSATLPADAAVPVYVMTVPATSNFTIDFDVRGRSFATGIVICNSSTGPTKTIGSADCYFDAQYT
jgi:hypothetical protein